MGIECDSLFVDSPHCSATLRRDDHVFDNDRCVLGKWSCTYANRWTRGLPAHRNQRRRATYGQWHMQRMASISSAGVETGFECGEWKTANKWQQWQRWVSCVSLCPRMADGSQRGHSMARCWCGTQRHTKSLLAQGGLQNYQRSRFLARLDSTRLCVG
jgi:hypothetical protein